MDLAILPTAGIDTLDWATWEYPHRWIPDVIHTTSFGWDTVKDYLRDWFDICEHAEQRPNDSHLLHFLFVAGLVLRDIHAAYFSLNDVDDDEPGDLPQFIKTTQLGLPFSEFIELMVKGVCASFARLTPPVTIPNAPLVNVIDPALSSPQSVRHHLPTATKAALTDSTVPQKRLVSDNDIAPKTKKARKNPVHVRTIALISH